MLIEIFFTIYLVILLAYTIYSGINYHRIQTKLKIHPQVITYMIPFIVNFFVDKYVFMGYIHPFLTTLFPCLSIFLIGRKLKQYRIFGLTGGIAAGKSTLVAQMKQHLQQQLLVIDCDQINKRLSQKGNAGYNLILSMLGPRQNQFLHPFTKQIIRQKFSDYVFNSPEFRKQLTVRMGRKIFYQIFKQIFDAFFGKKKLILIDAPILYETKVLTYVCYPIIVVGASVETQIRRMMQFRKISEDEAKARINSQMSLQQKKKRADIYVDNSGTVEQMFTQTLNKLNRMLQSNKKK